MEIIGGRTFTVKHPSASRVVDNGNPLVVPRKSHSILRVVPIRGGFLPNLAPHLAGLSSEPTTNPTALMSTRQT